MNRNVIAIIVLLWLGGTVSIQAQNEEKEGTSFEETSKSCQELKNPQTTQEVLDLKRCLRERKRARQREHEQNLRKRSFERSNDLVNSRLAPYCLPNRSQKRRCDDVLITDPNTGKTVPRSQLNQQQQ